MLVEGSFSLNQGTDEIVNSNEYISSDFSYKLLDKIQSSLENQTIKNVCLSDDSGQFTLIFVNGVVFDAHFREGEFESWNYAEMKILFCLRSAVQ